MVKHRFICDGCGKVVEDTNTEGVHKCPDCGFDMRWDLGGNASGHGDYHHFSESLGINPDQIPEHRKLFPNVDVLPDGRLHFTSVRQQERYANRCDFYKKPQKIKSKGKRI